MPEPGRGSSSDDPRLVAFELGREPVLVTEGPRHRVVAANAAARALLAEGRFGSDLLQALPGITADEAAIWSQTREDGAAAHLRVDLGRNGGARTTYDVRLDPWDGAGGGPRGVVAHLRPSGEHDVAAQMQEAVLPGELPVLPAVDVAGAYLLADEAEGVGGDWFDAVPTPGGALGFVVGDVAGRGLSAVATMAQLRAVARERLAAGIGVGDVVTALDAVARDLPDAAATTVCVALLDLGSGELAYCTAGHPPPLVVEPDGAARYLPRTGAPALAAGRSGFAVGDGLLEPGQLLLLYTDGVVERPSRSAAQNTLDLAGVAGAVFGDIGGGHGIRGTVDTVCERVLAELVSETGFVDDMVLVAAERMPDPAPIDLSVPAEPVTGRAVRAALWDWLHDLRARDLDLTAILHAVGEVVANAVEHAYADSPPPESDPIRVAASLTALGEVEITVRDRGAWRSGASTGRGRGLTIAGGLVDELHVDRRADGTLVTLRHRIGRPVAMFRPHASTGPAAPRGEQFHTLGEGPGRVSLHGHVDQLSAGPLRDELLRRTRGGTVSLVVDLSDVSFLGSVGVQLLAEAIGWSHDDVAVELVAPAGTPAQQVLETVGLPYRA